MHGRLKVKTTAEQQEAKRKEREKKMKLYNAATSKIFQKRQGQEYDQEALELTAQILSANSDFYTLWNYRKEIFLAFKEKSTEDELHKLFEDELSFLEACLKGNPKSYGCWEHRCFVMLTMPCPDWDRELMLCNKYLEYDERNFHCWDYRRFVVKRAQVTPEAEFEFTTSKISSNFSNYSSWHYRSKLLPLIHPDPKHPGGVKDDVLIKEFELAQNAFFTDPNDQSAWFYHRWLLGRAEKQLAIDCVYVSRELRRVMVRLSKPAKIGADLSLQVSLDGVQCTGEWTTPANSNDHSLLWLFNLTAPLDGNEHKVMVAMEGSSRSCTLKDGDEKASSVDEVKPGTLFSYQLSAATSDTLTQELDACQQLYELEPDNKWVLLTIMLLMRAIDPLKYLKETLEHIDTIIKVDPCRTNYYKDLRSKFLIENAIEEQGLSAKSVDLSNRELTTLRHTEYMCTAERIDLSNNKLSSLPGCESFQCVKELELKGNQLKSCEKMECLPLLEDLSLTDNSISTMEGLRPLTLCSKLKKLNIMGNPLCEQDDFVEELRNMLPSLDTLIT
ncbi:geranylgeranyl transferase type-2 subunit alpha-like [Lingula anatina]|uniref:Geranylgeranyl transferase type-2 subunit alpha n=1 Tax=Lingula anatina TaxID=7574 RepID=A0A1S3IUX9_LINAN|nr:geranylgeranyl transferase type-2 subunit alpha-like [Lingula anatina]|eukprot:XP_013402007.1 geranylgeranyl transferase type-2 subunit alpha-like [Lingula anatina]